MAIKIKINSSLRDLKGSYRDKVAKVVSESAVEIASIARQLAPKDTGHLADESIAVEQTPSTLVTRVVVKTADADHDEYGMHVEFGTSESAAQPFLRPAAAIVAPRMKRRLAHLKL